MKNLIIGLFLLILTGVSFASAIASKTTVLVALDQANAANATGSAQTNFLTIQSEFPLSNSSEWLVMLQIGSNYGVSSNNYRIGYKLELSQ